MSVVLPTYNGAERVLDAIRSVMRQTHSQWELKVVIDGSTDNTSELLDGLDDARIEVIALSANVGVAAARNAGIATASGEFVAFIDDDDAWIPEKLSRQVAVMHSDPKVCLVHGGVVDLMEDGRRLKRLPPMRASHYSENLVRDCLALSTVMVRRSALEDSGVFDPCLRAYEEWDLWSRILKVGQAKAVDGLLAFANQRPGSITHGDPDVLTRNRSRVLRRLWQENRRRGSRRRALAHHLQYTAGLYLTACKKSQARRRALKSLRLRPTLRAVILYGLTFTSPDKVAAIWRPLQGLRRRLRA